MSLIHQALKKIERKAGDDQSLAGVRLIQDKPGRSLPHRRRLIILIVCNVLAVGYLIWSWQPSWINTLLQRKVLQVAPVPVPPLLLGSLDQTVPQSPELTRLQAKALQHFRAQEWRESRDLWEQLILKEPLNPEHYNNLGLVLRKLGRWEDAMEQYRKALQLDPHFTQAHNNLGVLYLARGDHEAAQHFLNKAIEIDPAYSDPHLNLGFLFEMRGDWNRAKESYQAFLKVSDGHDDPMRPEVARRLEFLSSAATRLP